MWALSRPGLIRELPDPGQAGTVEALIDRECRVFCADPALDPAVARSGATPVAAELADHLFYDTLPGLACLAQINLGSDLYPETGATLVCAATLGHGTRLRLTGPGCNGAVDVAIDGLPAGFWETRARLMRYPMGFELFLIDGPRVLGVPRSCQVECV